ncbi:ParB family protein [Yinghuangia aomiensis]
MKLTAYVEDEILQRTRAAQFWTQTKEDGFRTLSDLVEEALDRVVRDLEEKHNGGAPFPEVPGKKLRVGRPPST